MSRYWKSFFDVQNYFRIEGNMKIIVLCRKKKNNKRNDKLKTDKNVYK